jgi:hypothetical protein
MFSFIKHFSQKMIFLEIFSGIWFVRKNHLRRKMESGDVRLATPDSGQTGQNLDCRNPAKSLDFDRNFQIPTSLAESGCTGQILAVLVRLRPVWPESGSSESDDFAEFQ